MKQKKLKSYRKRVMGLYFLQKYWSNNSLFLKNISRFFWDSLYEISNLFLGFYLTATKLNSGF